MPIIASASREVTSGKRLFGRDMGNLGIYLVMPFRLICNNARSKPISSDPRTGLWMSLSLPRWMHLDMNSQTEEEHVDQCKFHPIVKLSFLVPLHIMGNDSIEMDVSRVQVNIIRDSLEPTIYRFNGWRICIFRRIWCAGFSRRLKHQYSRIN
jgi:hypothetical protein